MQYKLCKVKRVQTGPKGIPFLVTHDGRTIRYPDPLIKVNDTIHLDIATGKILDSIRFDSGIISFSRKYIWNLLIDYYCLGNLCMITGGRNLGRVGTVVSRERHPGSFDICHIKDSQGHTFATRYLKYLLFICLYFMIFAHSFLLSNFYKRKSKFIFMVTIIEAIIYYKKYCSQKLVKMNFLHTGHWLFSHRLFSITHLGNTSIIVY